jgi:hypothetical protein
MHDYDISCKWMIQHHADAILRLAGFRNIASWKPLQAEPVHPRQLPDGLIEVQRPGNRRPIYFVLEASSYPTSGWPSRPAMMPCWSISSAAWCPRS